MIGLKAAVGSVDRGVIDRFHIMLRPLSNAVVTKSEAFERADRKGVPYGDAIVRFRDWAQPYLKKQATFVSATAEKDWPWIMFYVKKFLKEKPAGFDAVSASSWSSSATELGSFLKDLARFGWKNTEERPLRLPSQGIRPLAWSPDGRSLAVAGKGVEIWDVVESKCILTYAEHKSAVTALAWSPDGKRLASGEDFRGKKPGTIHVWEAATGKTQRVFEGWHWPLDEPGPGHSSGVNGLAFHPDGRILASASGDGTVKLWDLEKGELSRTFPARGSRGADRGTKVEVHGVAWSPDGRRIASCDGSGGWIDEQHYSTRAVHVWSKQGERLYSTSGSGPPMTRVAWSPDGERIVALYEDGDLLTIDSDEEAGYREWKAGATGLSFRSDGRCIATCGKDQAIRFWNFPERTLRRAIEGLPDVPADLAFSPEGLRLAVATAKGILVWNLLPDFVSEEAPPKIEPRGIDPVWRERFRVLVFEPDGRQSQRDFDSQEAASACADDVCLGEEPRKIAVVIDSKSRVVHKGGPYRLVRVPDPKVAVKKPLAPLPKGKFRVLWTRFGVQEPHKDFASLSEARTYAERMAAEHIGSKKSCVILDSRYRVVCAVPNRKQRRW